MSMDPNRVGSRVSFRPERDFTLFFFEPDEQPAKGRASHGATRRAAPARSTLRRTVGRRIMR
jgi:hypothetical protein